MIARLLPIIAWLPRYRRSDSQADLIAGFTTAVMLIPQAMGYAMLAGLPPLVGLYAALVPALVYAPLGTSRQLSVGPVAMDSLLVAVALGGLASVGTDNYLALAAALGILVGLVQLTLGVLRLGFVVNFLSRPVISGFTSAAALIIAASQLKYLLRLELPNSHLVPKVLYGAAQQVTAVHGPTLIVGASSIAVLLLLRRFAPRVPRALCAVTLGTLTVWGLDLHELGVPIVGHVPSGLPSFRLPTLDLNLAQTLLPSALTISLVSFMEAISIGKHFARKNRYELDPSQELIALGAANLAGGLFGGYPVAGGVSRTAVAATAGARTQLFSLVTVLGVAVTLLWLTPLLHYLPKATLSAIIVTAVINLLDFAEPVRLWRIKRVDLALLLLTFVLTLSVGIQWGILLGLLASLLLFLVQTTRPHVALLGKIPGTTAYLNCERHPHAEPEQGVLIVRIDSQFYFGNVTFLKETLQRLETQQPAPTRAVVLDAAGVNQLDSSAEAALQELDEAYRERNIPLLFCHVKGPVRDVMYRSGLLQRLHAEGRIHLLTHEAVQAALHWPPLQDTHPTSKPNIPPLEALDSDPRHPADRIGCGKLQTS